MANGEVTQNPGGLVFSVHRCAVAVGLFPGLEDSAAFVLGIRIQDEISANKESLVIRGGSFIGYEILLNFLPGVIPSFQFDFVSGIGLQVEVPVGGGNTVFIK